MYASIEENFDVWSSRIIKNCAKDIKKASLPYHPSSSQAKFSILHLYQCLLMSKVYFYQMFNNIFTQNVKDLLQNWVKQRTFGRYKK
jgi:hypothetical protein